MFCPNCGNLVKPEAKFCPNCGKPVPGAMPVSSAPTRPFVPETAPAVPEIKPQEAAPIIQEPAAPSVPESKIDLDEFARQYVTKPAEPEPPVIPEQPAAPQWQVPEVPQYEAPVQAEPFVTAPAVPEYYEEEKPSAEVSVGKFIGLFLLFMLPVIGLISIIIFGKNKNRNIRNFARMCYIPHIIFMLILIAVAAISLLMYYCVDEIKLYNGINTFGDAIKKVFDKLF